MIDNQILGQLSQLGHVWTIDEPDEMTNLIDLGVHGLMSGRPSVLKSVLEKRGIWR